MFYAAQQRDLDRFYRLHGSLSLSLTRRRTQMSFTPNNSGLAGQRQRRAPNAPQLTARGAGEMGKRDGPVTDLSSVASHTMHPADRTLLYTICSLFILISLGMAYSHFHHSPAVSFLSCLRVNKL